MSAADLDNIDNCPLGVRCESCGVEVADLAVTTASTPLGVLCLTLCSRCADADVSPPITVSTAARLVRQHAGHLRIDLDEMAEAMGEVDR
jgi:hypothetical protein